MILYHVSGCCPFAGYKQSNLCRSLFYGELFVYFLFCAQLYTLGLPSTSVVTHTGKKNYSNMNKSWIFTQFLFVFYLVELCGTCLRVRWPAQGSVRQESERAVARSEQCSICAVRWRWWGWGWAFCLPLQELSGKVGYRPRWVGILRGQHAEKKNARCLLQIRISNWNCEALFSWILKPVSWIYDWLS